MGTRIMYVEREEKKDDPAGFTDEADVRRIIDKIAAGVGKTVNVADPYADAELYDGSRALLMIPPISDRPNIIIRKHTYGTKQLPELAPGMQNLTPEIIGYFKQAVTDRKNIVVIGQTGSGKTTFLNALTYYFPPKHIVAVLEDTHEMVLPLTYVYYLKTREASGEVEAITWVGILRNCLRANPNLYRAIESVTEYTGQPLRQYLDAFIRRVESGEPIDESLKQFKTETNIDSISEWVDSIIFAHMAKSDITDVCDHSADRINRKLVRGMNIHAVLSKTKGAAFTMLGLIALMVVYTILSSPDTKDLILGTGTGQMILIYVIASLFITTYIIMKQIDGITKQ
jgi:energy-coupling factor transporter ATP-binding protein EcfA2